MANTILIVIEAVIIFSFLFNQFLNGLNSKYRKKVVPPELSDVYDAEGYKKSQEYGIVRDKFSAITSSYSTILILVMLTFGGFNFINNISLTISINPIVSAIIYLCILLLAADILNIPFEIYSIFVIEEKFGFNKLNTKTFIFDKIKGLIISAILGGGIFALIIWLYLKTNNLFPVFAWISLTVFSIFFAMFYTSLIVPLFNKQTPLPDGELKNAVNEISKKTGFKIDKIFVIDGSKRSTKANAYFSGLGNKKRIVLFDTLIKDLSVNEIVAVLAHEIGHYKKRHILQSLIFSAANSAIMLFLFSVFVDNIKLSNSLGSQNVSFTLGLTAFGLLYSPVSAITGFMFNFISRRNEFKADNFAKSLNLENELVSALKKLSSKSLSNLTPHPVYVLFNYSHPTLYQRIKSLQK